MAAAFSNRSIGVRLKQLRAAADDALGKCKESRMALARHKAEHGC
jgi:hypothetical protein